MLLVVVMLDGMTLVRTRRWGFLEEDDDGGMAAAPAAKAWSPPDNLRTNADEDEGMEPCCCWC